MSIHFTPDPVPEKEELLAYLNDLAVQMVAVPSAYPATFADLYQPMRFVTDREALAHWLEAKRVVREDALKRGVELPPHTYEPFRGVPDALVDPAYLRLHCRVPYTPFPRQVAWNDQTSAEFPRLVVLGERGLGKSWFLRADALLVAQHAAATLRASPHQTPDITWPIFVDLADLRPDQTSLAETVIMHVARGRSQTFATFLHQLLTTTSCTLYLDSWERCAPALRQQFANFAAQYPHLRLRLACRTSAYETAHLPGVTEVELVGFDRNQVTAGIRKIFTDSSGFTIGSQLLALFDLIPALENLARVPAFLTIICQVVKQNPTFPLRRADLYQPCLNYFLSGDQAELHEPLQYLAEQLCQQGHDSFTSSYLEEFIGHWLGQLTPPHPLFKTAPAVLSARLQHCGLLSQAKPNQWLFRQRGLQEFLACQLLAAQENAQAWYTAWQWVKGKAWLPAWRELIALLAGQAEFSGTILDLLANLNGWYDDYFFHQMSVAGYCLSELTPAQAEENALAIGELASILLAFWWQPESNPVRVALAPIRRVLPGLVLAGTPLDEENFGNRRLLEFLAYKLEHKSTAGGDESRIAMAINTILPTQELVAWPASLLSLRDKGRYRKRGIELTAFILRKLKVKTREVGVDDLPAALRVYYQHGSAAVRELVAWAMSLLTQPDQLLSHLEMITTVQHEMEWGLLRAQVLNESQPLNQSEWELWQVLGTLVDFLRARVLTPELLDRLAQEVVAQDKRTLQTAQLAIRALGSQAATPAILNGLSDCLVTDDHESQTALLMTLATLGHAAAIPPILERVTELLEQSQSEYTLGAAAWLLGSLSNLSLPSPLLNSLINLLYCRQLKTQMEAAWALQQLLAQGQRLFLEDKHAFNRWPVQKHLEGIDRRWGPSLVMSMPMFGETWQDFCWLNVGWQSQATLILSEAEK